MKTIGIKEFESLVYECLENPGAFANKSIILWKASFDKSGIAYRVIEYCCIEHNKKYPTNQVWYLSSVAFETDEITDMRACCHRKDMSGFKNQGILFNGGWLLQSDLNNWLKFVNTRENKKGHLSKGWVLIACANGLDDHLFSDTCDVYAIQPSLNEWAEWAARFNSQEVFNPILAYIESKETLANFDNWQKVMDALDREIRHAHLESLKQMSETDFDKATGGLLGTHDIDFPSKDLWNFIQAYE